MKRLLVILALVLILIIPSLSALADGSRGIYASCPKGAYAGIAGSGYVTVTFYYDANYATRIYSARYYLGGGSSRVVYSPYAGSYRIVTLSGNGYVSSAGCRS